MTATLQFIASLTELIALVHCLVNLELTDLLGDATTRQATDLGTFADMASGSLQGLTQVAFFEGVDQIRQLLG